jgi:hypothetical protein
MKEVLARTLRLILKATVIIGLLLWANKAH